MSIERRLQRLEQQSAVSDAELWERCEAVGRTHDLYPPEIYEEARRFLAMTPAQREQALAELQSAAESRGAG